MPTFFVSGLCMQGNKGGPALALSLVECIRTFIPDAHFVFAVPGSANEWPHETRWAEAYGFPVVKAISAKDFIPPFSLSDARRKRFRKWLKAVKEADAFIQMSAICYVGPPSGSGSLKSMITSSRYTDFVLTRLMRKKMYAWTQSYGPLTTSAVRLCARMDLKRQPIVFCRGDDCRDAVKALLPDSRALSFPDVAITLPYDRDSGRSLLKIFSLANAPFVTLSPSAVMYARSNTQAGNTHVEECISICRNVLDLGYSILLVPHTVRPSAPDPRRCDREVARLVHEGAADEKIQLLEEDLSPVQLKSIIANAQFHIGARYHSLVAALSTGVPSISISWHPKYRDLMRAYGQERFTLEEQGEETASSLIDTLVTDLNASRQIIHGEQEELAAEVYENARLFCELLQGGTS